MGVECGMRIAECGMRRFWLFVVAVLVWVGAGDVGAESNKMLIYMDLEQVDHLKAYGVAYWALDRGVNVEWLLNYRGGSFMLDAHPEAMRQARVQGVGFSEIDAAQVFQVYSAIESANMERILLEKAPKVAVYTPPNSQPWDDAVTLALTYAEIPYETVWDEEVLSGMLDDYDWLHLHHEDFTGQYGKFYATYGRTPWYQEQQTMFEAMAHRLGFSKVSEEKKAVTRAIKAYVVRGGFLFAMCSATDTFDIALAAENTDIVEATFDGDPMDPDAQQKLDFTKTFAFKDFALVRDPLVYEFSDIDTTPMTLAGIRGAEADYFTLFEFSAKYDPVPTMLTQNHVAVINGFLGQTTAYHQRFIRKSVVIMGQVEGTDEVKYIHGNAGKGTFTFYAGHDPEDYQHRVGDPPTQLTLHKHSPGYRLILNNVLFPAAKKKELKT